MTDRLPPQSFEAESALVGSLLVDRDAIAAVDWLTPDAFASAAAADVFSAVLSLWKRRIPADLVTVTDELERMGRYEDVGGAAMLSAFATSVPTSAHIEYYAQTVARLAKLRRYIDLGTEIVRGAYKSGEGHYDPTDAINDALRAVESLTDPSQRSTMTSYADLIPDWQTEILDSWDGIVYTSAIPTGFRYLDDALDGGLRPSELTLVGGRPGSGKTSFALQLAHEAARYRKGEMGTVVIFSAEMNVKSLLWRATAEVSGVDAKQIRTGKIPIALRDRILFATEHMASMPVVIDDTSGITTAQMMSRVQRLQRSGKVALVVFDYIEIAGDRDESEERRVGKIGGALKHIARVCEVPVVALCQLSRAVEQRKDRRPQMSDLRYSGSLEAHADVIMMLYREGYYVAQGLMDPTPGKEDVVDVILAKQRNGVTGTYPVRWFGETMSFSDLDVDRRGEWPS